jgi:hypothetical protein
LYLIAGAVSDAGTQDHSAEIIAILLFPGMVGVGHGGINRAYFRALGRFEMTHALDTLIGVDDVLCLPFADGLYRAFWLTSPATDALVSNFICHSIYLLILSLERSGTG